MLRLVCAALFALALVVMPASMSTQYADQARAEATTKGEKAAEKAATKKATGEKKAAQEARADREAEGGRRASEAVRCRISGRQEVRQAYQGHDLARRSIATAWRG